MTNLRYEAWPKPGTPSYDVVVRDLQAVAGSGTLPKTPIGNGAVEIPRGALRIDGTSVLDAVVFTDPTTPANDVTSVIRVYRVGDAETAPIHEWLVEDPVAESDDAGTVRLAGRNVEAILDYEHVEMFDWDGSAVFLSRFPDHIYGGKNILQNPGLETGPLINDVYDVRHDHLAGTFRLRPDTTFTANMVFNVSAGVMETEIETALTTDGFTNPDARVTIATPPTDFTEAWLVEIVVPNQFLGMIGDDALLTGGTALVVDNIQAGGRSTGQWTKSTDLSRGVLTEHGTYASDGFRLSTGAEPVLSGLRSLRVNGLTQFAGAQQLVRVKPGGTYQLVMPMFTSNGVDIFRSVIRTADEQFIASSSPFAGVISGSVGAWDSTTFGITNVVIPDGVNQVVVRFAYVGTGNPGPFLLDDMEFNEGLAAASPGNILIDLFDDAQTDHAPTRAALTFINLDFTGAVDSDGAAWADTTVSMTIKRRQSYFQMMRQFEKLNGYEWRLTPTVATPGEWDLQVYNNGTLGVDFGGLDDPAIVIGQGTLPSAVTRQRPVANYLMAEGAGGLTARTSSAASIGAVGRRAQGIFDRRFTDSAHLTTWVASRLSKFLSETLAPRIVIQEPNVSDDWPRPMDEYSPGDTVDFILADGATRIERRIESVSYQDTGQDGLKWTVEGGSAAPFVSASGGGSGGRSGVGETPTVTRAREQLGTASGSQMKVLGVAVRALLEEFRFDEDQEVAPLSITPAAGGVPTVFVVASDATDKEQGMADYQCLGVSDQLVIHEARDFLDNHGGGRLVFSSGIFQCDTVGIDQANDPILDLFGDIVYQGMSPGQVGGTFIKVDATSTMNGAADSAAVRVGASRFTTLRDIQIEYTGNENVGDADPSYFFGVKLMGFAHLLNTLITGTGDGLSSVVAVDSGIENIIDTIRIDGSTSASIGPDNLLRFINGSAWTFVNNLHGQDCRSHGILIESLDSGDILCNIKLEDIGVGTADTFDGVHIEDGVSEGSQTRQILVSNLVVDAAFHRSALFIAGVNTQVGYTNIVSNGHNTAIVIDNGRPAGGQQRAVEVATATTMHPYSAIFNVDTSGGAVAMTMPDNAEAQGAVIVVIRDGGSNVTVVRAGTDTFSDGSTTVTLDTDNTAVMFISIGDGEWKILTPSTISSGAAIDHDDLSNVTVDQHHTEAHTIASHSDTTATGTELETLTDGSNADALHAHAPIGGADHGGLTGLSDIADHTYAALTDGTRNITGNQRFTIGLVLSNAQRLQLEGSTASSVWDWRTLGDSLALRFNSTATGEDERILIEIDGDYFLKNEAGLVVYEYRESLTPKRHTFNQIIALGLNGSAANPALASVNDFDSGIFWGTDILGFAAGGIEFFRLTEAGTDTMDLSVDIDMQTNSLLNALNLTDGGNADALHTHAAAEDAIPNILMLGGM